MTLLSALCAAAGCGGHSNALPLPPVSPAGVAQESPRAIRNAIGPRYQWNHNYGYCGEVSFISAGLYFGEYLSQYDARAAADHAPQNRYRSQLLLGENDLHAAQTMHLNAIEWNRRTERNTAEFLAWVKSNALLGRPVAIGIYMNQYRFYHDRNPKAGSPQYDHIVPVIGVGSGELTFSDNGEWSSGLRNARYFFTYTFAGFPRSRREANDPRGPIYSTANDGRNYGIAITGVADRNHETLPVSVSTSLNYERPQIVQGSTKPPPPEPLVLTITLSGLEIGQTYNLYRYNTLAAIPDGRFNANAGRASEKWRIAARAKTFSMTERIRSDEVAAYRAVPVKAP